MALTRGKNGTTSINAELESIVATLQPVAGNTFTRATLPDADENDGRIVCLSDSTEAVAATYSTTLTGENNDITLTAKTAGVAGNSITIALVDPSEASQSLSIDVTGTDIVVNLATDAESAITTTASLLIAAINADAEASALVTAALKGTDTEPALSPRLQNSRLRAEPTLLLAPCFLLVQAGSS
jgi:hypothetical protein